MPPSSAEIENGGTTVNTKASDGNDTPPNDSTMTPSPLTSHADPEHQAESSSSPPATSAAAVTPLSPPSASPSLKPPNSPPLPSASPTSPAVTSPAPSASPSAPSPNAAPSPSSPSSSPSLPPSTSPQKKNVQPVYGHHATHLALRQTSWQNHLPPKVQRILRKTNAFMDGPVMLSIVVIATLITIFLDDIRITSFPPSADGTFENLTIFFFSLFCAELLVNAIVKPGYFLSFFFYLDLISAFSLLPDIPSIWNPMIGLESDDTGEDDENGDITRSEIALEVDRVRRVSRTALRLIKVLKFVKLIRLGRIAKLFEMAQRTMEERTKRKRRAKRKDSNTIHAKDHTQSSQVGQTLSEQTTRKVVILVLLMLFCLPLMQPTVEDHATEFMVGELNYAASQAPTLGQVKAKLAMDGVTYIAITDEEASNRQANGLPVTIFNSTQLSTFLVDYDANLGQPYPSGDRYSTLSPPLNTSYIATIVSPEYLNVTVAALSQARTVMDFQFQYVISYFSDTMLYLRVRGQYYSNDFVLDELFTTRSSEMLAAEDGTGPGGKSYGVFSIESVAVEEAIYSMCRAVIALVLLTAGALAFNHNNQRMVIEPIERMVATIVQLQKNPLARAVIDDDDDDGKAQAANNNNTTNNNNSNTAETGMLERTLQKLTGLLQVGFGEAGSRMIQKCMVASADGDLDPLVDGTRMLAIFGFCDIRRFTDATECLREDVMMYVNEIAAIVHSHVSLCDGHPNKNVGDAFLVVWRLRAAGHSFDPDDLFSIQEVQPRYLRPTVAQARKKLALASDTVNAAEREAAEAQEKAEAEHALLERAKQSSASIPPQVRNVAHSTRAQIAMLADKAVVSFLRIIVELDASEQLREYEQHPRIKAAFDDFQVQLGFGLHCGWAIEGPIGSRYKIDASYLSPHVNLSESLQDLTKIYGCPLLLSGEFYTLLSPYMKSYMRRLDVVKVAGRDIPMNLYAFDIHPRAMKSIIARQTPDGYDIDADIDVVECSAQHFQKAAKSTTSPFQRSMTLTSRDGDFTRKHSHAEAVATANAAWATTTTGGAGAVPLHSSSLPASPSSFSIAALNAACLSHPLFSNPHLNPSLTDFSSYTYTGVDRSHIHSSSPIATYHLLYNFRLSALQCAIPHTFYDLYEDALNAYLDGDWSVAKERMEQAQQLYPEDRATQVILDIMKKHDYVAPDQWAGWHEA